MASSDGNLLECVAAADRSLKQQWQASLEQAIAELGALHTDAALAAQWRALPVRDAKSSAPAGEAPADDVPTGDAPGVDEPVSIAVLRRRRGRMDVYRATWEQACDDPAASIARVHAVLQSAARMPAWLPVVEGADVLEVLAPGTAVVHARFRLGWPTSPRDAILLTYAGAERDAAVYVATSVPRTPDAPSFLRPSPPYVRAHVHLSATVVRRVAPGRLAFAAYWSWDLHGALLGIRSNAMVAFFPRQLPSLWAYAAREGDGIARLVSYGAGVEVTALGGGVLDVSYTVLADEDEEEACADEEARVAFGADARVAPRTLLLALPAAGAGAWDVQIEAKAARGAPPAWRACGRAAAFGTVVRVEHGAVADAESFVRVRLEVRAGEGRGVRVNGAALEAETDAGADAAAALARPASVPLVRRIAAARRPRASRSPSPRSRSRSRSPTPSAPASPARAVSPLAALVRRNYIYFTSLLQEPEAKWKRVSDVRGVTVTQLDSIDPTLVVYRAEATFVGLSVWDFFSTLSYPELAAQWDAGVGDAELVRDMGGQSVVWHLHTRATWTTSARDAVLVQTAYKAPNSIHLFAFSAAGGALPGLAVPDAGAAIRTQVDLRGWSIEALSPTTVHVTLIEQSDPGGWLSKASLPAQMITSMASIGEYTIQHGAPPVATRLLHARAHTARYDHAQGAFTLVYAAARDELVDGRDTVEGEIRCSMEAWAPNLDVAVTPGPRHAACLRRHKLSLGGGGLWLTLEHSAEQLAHEPVTVVIRKGPAQSRERHVVLLNGTRMHVDTDDLDAAQVQALARRKRTKPQRVPLDFAVSGAEDAEAPAARAPAPAAAPAAPAHPMQAALDALFLLRRIDSERHPDPAGVPAGWTLVSERAGLYVRRKVLESLSPTVAVQRADKIVQGIAAEELVRLVSNVGCRHLWDERMGAATVLASYGSGASTASWTAHGTFPFRPRRFVVGSVTACGSQAAPLTPSGLLSPTSSRQPVYFHASASCEDAAVDAAGADAALPLGRVLIDGWIFETLDPYSPASYPIPSTRATHVVAIDYGGAMPAAVNALWNAPLPRATLRLEQFLRQHGPTPSLRTPPAWMHVAGDGHDDDRTLVWTLERPARAVALLTHDFAARTRTFEARVALPPQDVRQAPAPPPLSLPSAAAAGASPTSPTLHRATSRTLRRHDAAAAAAAAELVVLDVQLELQHYPQGYALEVAWDDAPGAPIDLSARPARMPSDALPLQVRVYDRPPSALQAATRDAVDRSHKHLVRVLLPDPGGVEAPAWCTRLQTSGAAVRLTATPLPAPSTAARAADTGQVPVTCNGKVAEITYGDDAARAVPDAAPLLDQLERVARPAAHAPSTPRTLPHGWTRAVDAEVLAHPLAEAHAPLARAPASDAAPAPGGGAARHPPGTASDAHGAPASGASSPGSARSAGAREPASGPRTPPAPMFGLLRPSTLSSMLSHGAKDDEGAQPPGHLHAEPAAPRTSLRGQPRYRRSTLVLVAIVSFLLGSLLRSFVQPADYVLVRAGGTDAPPARPEAPYAGVGMLDLAAREIEGLVRAARGLSMFGEPGGAPDALAHEASAEPMVSWREVRRFLDVRLSRRWDVVVALVRR
ncbi:hypothetical protein MOBT1_003009 [Malassezia obtusa]|uniref:START domain-containing protein n=1 Tax=Malassezia obtusa TaxID=76774 RepID=A0AAF0E691_9BASI|nr:hypothetical protein MOBT1_003009 [Malassezia obtusa]